VIFADGLRDFAERCTCDPEAHSGQLGCQADHRCAGGPVALRTGGPAFHPIDIARRATISFDLRRYGAAARTSRLRRAIGRAVRSLVQAGSAIRVEFLHDGADETSLLPRSRGAIQIRIWSAVTDKFIAAALTRSATISFSSPQPFRTAHENGDDETPVAGLSGRRASTAPRSRAPCRCDSRPRVRSRCRYGFTDSCCCETASRGAADSDDRANDEENRPYPLSSGMELAVIP